MLKKNQLIEKRYVQHFGQLASIILKTQNFTKNREFYSKSDIDGASVICYFIGEVIVQINYIDNKEIKDKYDGSEDYKNKLGQLGRLTKRAGYGWDIVEKAARNIIIQKDKEAALDYLLEFARKGVSESEFFGAVMDLIMDEKTERMRFKFGDGGVAELVQVSKPLDEE